MSNERDISSGFSQLLYSVGSVALLRLSARPALRQVLIRKMNKNFHVLYAQATEDANDNWDAIQEVLGAYLGRPIKLSDLTRFDRMGETYRWYYTEHATRGAWLRWTAVMASPLIRAKGRGAYLAELRREHLEAHNRLVFARKNLLDFGVPEPFMHVTFRETLVPA